MTGLQKNASRSASGSFAVLFEILLLAAVATVFFIALTVGGLLPSLVASLDRVASGHGAETLVLAVVLSLAIAVLATHRWVGADRELTHLRRTAAYLKGRSSELEQRVEDLDQFTYVVSHDLREPLRMVESYLKLLEQRTKGRLDADAETFIHYAKDGAARMRGLLEDLLLYTRAGANAVTVPAASGEALDRALSSLQLRVEEAGAVVTRDPMPVVLADPTFLAQVFQNLVGNALKFRATSVAPQIHVGARRRGDEWTLSVRDNGIGIDPDGQKRLFHLFTRLHTAEEYPGNGVGLAVCRKIVEAQGGRISVESRPGEGSTFRFTLAASDGAVPGPAAAERVRPRARRAAPQAIKPESPMASR